MSDMFVSQQRDAQRQLDDLKQEQERRLRDTRNDFKRREADIRESGEAAISHIRKETESKVDTARNDANARLKRDAEQINKNYGDLRRRAVQQSESLERQTIETRERAERNISSVRANENAAMERSQERLRDFLRSQQELRAVARDESTAELERTKAEGGKRLMMEKGRQVEKVENLKAENTQVMNDMRLRNRLLYEETRSEAQRRLTELKQRNDEGYKKERDHSHDSLNSLRHRYGEAITHQQREGERRLTHLEQENQRQLEKNKARALRTKETMQAEYSSETQRIESTGQQEINDRQQKYDRMLREQHTAGTARLKEDEALMTAQELKARKEHQIRLAEDQAKADDAIIRQKKQFHERYDVNEKAHKSSLDHQKEIFLKELYRSKEKIDQKIGVEKNRENDPFYQLKTFHAKLSESPGAYELSAKVSPHDRHNVDVRVKDDKIILSAKRAYEDKYANEGVRTTTNAYQTFRQDFKLDVPVDAKRVITKIADDGAVSVFVPKKGSVKGSSEA